MSRYLRLQMAAIPTIYAFTRTRMKSRAGRVSDGYILRRLLSVADASGSLNNVKLGVTHG